MPVYAESSSGRKRVLPMSPRLAGIEERRARLGTAPSTSIGRTGLDLKLAPDEDLLEDRPVHPSQIG